MIGALSLYSEICISMSTFRLFYMLIWWQESLIKYSGEKCFCNHLVLFKAKLYKYPVGNYTKVPSRTMK